MTARIVARGACSPLGVGKAAFFSGREGEGVTTCVQRDRELADAKLTRPFAARVQSSSSSSLVIPPNEDRAAVLLEVALRECAGELDVAFPEWRQKRVGLAIGTSSGGMRSFETELAHADKTARMSLRSTYIGPVGTALRRVPLATSNVLEPFAFVLAACASSTIAIGVARAWLLEDRCDVVLCGGFDAVSVFVAAGFEALRATCVDERGPRPFREGRDGLALGEGAAVLALTRSTAVLSAGRVGPSAFVTGFGLTCDATHLTAPDPEGVGLARAASQALAGLKTEVDLVSAHGTATPQNDASEAKAIAAVAQHAPVFAFKGVVGHTLGAAGALELLAVVNAMERNVAPASAGLGAPLARVLDRAAPLDRRAAAPLTALKLSSAFGGVNAALGVRVTVDPNPTEQEEAAAPLRPAFATFAEEVAGNDPDAVDPAALSERTGYSIDRIARADDLVRLSLAAVAKLSRAGRRAFPPDTGIIVGHGLATMETNAKFQARITSAGAARAEPRRFPYTTPNAAAGECAVAFKLAGPSLSVGGGAHGGIEALLVATSLVRTGVVDRMIVVAADEAGETTARVAPGTRSGAVALLVSHDAEADGCALRIETCNVRLEVSQEGPDAEIRGHDVPPMHAHEALRALAKNALPPTKTPNENAIQIEASVTYGGIAKVSLVRL